MKVKSKKCKFGGITLKLETKEEALFILAALNQNNNTRKQITSMIPTDALRDMGMIVDDVEKYFEKNNYDMYCDFKSKLSVTT